MKKIVICTGATGGLGRNYSREMLSRGYHVIMTSRNEQSGQQLVAELQHEFSDGSLELMLLDLGDMASIEKFAAEFSAKYDRLDILVHNAGVYFFDKARKTTADGVELNLGIHFVGPFALTARLFPLLKKTAGSRVVSVSSAEHRGNPVALNDIQMASDFASLGNMAAYSRSKWALLAFTFELARRIKQEELNIHAVAAHPGVSITGIQSRGNPTVFQKAAIWVIGKLFAGKPEDAAKPLVMASTEGTGGEFFGPTGFKELKGAPGQVEPDAGTKDPQIGKTLWKVAEELTGVEFAV